jgi:arginyl-tRNA synthetase
MIEQRLIDLIRRALQEAADEFGVASLPDDIELTRPKQKEFGDFATNVALVVSARAGRSPREVAETLVRHLPPSDLVARVDVAGPGFINLHLAHIWLQEVLREVVGRGSTYGRGEPTGQSVQVEFVSANPTGPLHVGHARNAALGDAVGSVLEAAGYRVEREYYCNDAGRQTDLFAQSVEARYLERLGLPASLPDDGYRGEHIADVARMILERHGPALADLDPEARLARIRGEALSIMLEEIEATLARFNVRFDTWFSQREMQETGAVEKAVERLRESGHAYERDGAVWFRATEFGDDKDRVLIRSSGQPTYFAADCAYLLSKFNRGFDHLLYVLGADHHGDVKRLQGAAQAFGFDPARLEILLYQFVSFTKGGEPVSMSKRTGELVTLDELLDLVGPDAARYTLLSRSLDSPMEFDVEEVGRQSLENPVYYVQYAHARIASILRKAAARGASLGSVEDAKLELLTAEPELDLLRRIAELPREVAAAASLRAPHRLTRYSEQLAADFHRFYTECRVVSDDEELSRSRLWLCVGTRQVVATVLGLLGVSAPESMEREPGSDPP